MTIEQGKTKKDYILANIDKYVIDGQGNFYWEDAEEGMEYIYEKELKPWEIAETVSKIGRRILDTKNEWTLEFIKDDIHTWPLLLFKNKEDGRVIYYKNLYNRREIGKAINDYKGKDMKCLKTLRLKSIITEEQNKLLEELKKAEQERLFGRKPVINNNHFPNLSPLPNNSSRESEKQRKKEQTLPDFKLNPRQESVPNIPNNSEMLNFPPQELIINNNSSSNREVVLRQTIQQIHQLLVSKKLKTSDLTKEYQNWAEQLKNLLTKEEIINYFQNLKQVITEQTNSNHQPASNGFPLLAKIGIGVGVSLLMIGLFSVLMIKRSKKKI